MASVNSKFDAEHRDHVELAFKPDDTAADGAILGQATSGYEGLSLWQTVKTFKVATLVCFAASFSAATDGYQIGYVVRGLSGVSRP